MSYTLHYVFIQEPGPQSCSGGGKETKSWGAEYPRVCFSTITNSALLQIMNRCFQKCVIYFFYRQHLGAFYEGHERGQKSPGPLKIYEEIPLMKFAQHRKNNIRFRNQRQINNFTLLFDRMISFLYSLTRGKEGYWLLKFYQEQIRSIFFKI
jgi:hypothetical protein